ncbi:MAG TPA: SH3 domain-containing protein [bacterium]|nr:SH3 domain-containing protein [bacterium]
MLVTADDSNFGQRSVNHYITSQKLDVHPRYQDIIEKIMNDVRCNNAHSLSSILIRDQIVFQDSSRMIIGAIYLDDCKIMNMYLVKLDRNDELIWRKIVDNQNIIVPNKIYQLKDGNFLALGYYTQVSGRKYSQVVSDMYIQKFTQTGKEVWQKRFTDPEYSQEAILARELDNSILIVGIQNNGQESLYLAAIDNQGNVEWQGNKALGGDINTIDLESGQNSLTISGETMYYETTSDNYQKEPFQFQLVETASNSFSITRKGESDPKPDPAVKKMQSEDADQKIEIFGTAIITDSEVLIRNKPTLKSSILGVLQKNDSCQVLAKTQNVYPIRNMKNHWYELKCRNMTGWVYGRFIRFKEE